MNSKNTPKDNANILQAKQFAQLATKGFERLSTNEKLHQAIWLKVECKELEDPYALCLMDLTPQLFTDEKVLAKVKDLGRIEQILESLSIDGQFITLCLKKVNICIFKSKEKEIARARYLIIGDIEPLEDNKVKFRWSNFKYSFPKEKLLSKMPESISEKFKSTDCIISKDDWYRFIAYLSAMFGFDYIEMNMIKTNIIGYKYLKLTNE